MKNLSSLLASVLVLGISVSAQAAFPDVPNSHPHSQAIDYVKSKGIVSGNPDGTFKPDANISRAAFTKIIVETYFPTSNFNSCKSLTTFADVPTNAWFAPYVCVAVNQNLVKGYDDGTFRPGDNINIAEASKIISAYRKGIRAGNPWFAPYLEDLGSVGAIPTQVSTADQSVTRGLMAEMIHRLDAKITTKSAKVFEGGRLVVRVASPVTPVVTSAPASSPATLPLAEPIYETFSESRYNQLLESGDKFVLNFSASWCPNCKRLDKTLNADLSDLPKGSVILKTDYDRYGDLKKQYGVTSQTTGVFIEGGQSVSKKLGLSFNDIAGFFK